MAKAIWEYVGAMIASTFKLVAGAGLFLATTGAWPNPRYGAAIAVGSCIVAAIVLHFVAP